MKKSFSLILFAFPSFIFGQMTDSILAKKIIDSLPNGWRVIYNKTTVTVLKKDSVWFYNGINAPLELKPSEHPPFGAYKSQYKMEIRIQPSWSSKQMRTAVKNNSSIMNKIYEKYKMNEITNKNGDYAPKNDDETKRVEAYYKECEQAQSQLVIIPTMNTEKNSFIIHTNISETGFSIWPQKSSGEIYNTEAKIYSILRK